MTKKGLFYYLASFSGKAKVSEYIPFLIVDICSSLAIMYLFYKIDMTNEITFKNMFYECLILLVTFIPLQASITRRLRYLNFPTWLIVLNYIPVVKYAFKLLLLFNFRKLNRFKN